MSVSRKEQWLSASLSQGARSVHLVKTIVEVLPRCSRFRLIMEHRFRNFPSVLRSKVSHLIRVLLLRRNTRLLMVQHLRLLFRLFLPLIVSGYFRIFAPLSIVFFISSYGCLAVLNKPFSIVPPANVLFVRFLGLVFGRG